MPKFSEFVTLVVKHIAVRTTVQDLKDLFSKYGQVMDVFIPVDSKTGQRRRYGFVRFRWRKGADDAMEALDGHVLHGSTLWVRRAYRRFGYNIAEHRKIVGTAWKGSGKSNSIRSRSASSKLSYSGSDSSTRRRSRSRHRSTSKAHHSSSADTHSSRSRRTSSDRSYSGSDTRTRKKRLPRRRSTSRSYHSSSSDRNYDSRSRETSSDKSYSGSEFSMRRRSRPHQHQSTSRSHEVRNNILRSSSIPKPLRAYSVNGHLNQQ